MQHSLRYLFLSCFDLEFERLFLFIEIMDSWFFELGAINFYFFALVKGVQDLVQILQGCVLADLLSQTEAGPAPVLAMNILYGCLKPRYFVHLPIQLHQNPVLNSVWSLFANPPSLQTGLILFFHVVEYLLEAVSLFHSSVVIHLPHQCCKLFDKHSRELLVKFEIVQLPRQLSFHI